MIKSDIPNNVLKFNRKVFPFLAVITVFSLFIESYTYVGFLRKIFFVDSRVILYISFCAACLVYLDKQLRVQTAKKTFKLEAFVFKLNNFIFPTSSLLFFAMEIMEAQKYINYNFSTFHIQPGNFFYIPVFSGGLVILSLLDKFNVTTIDKQKIASQGVFHKALLLGLTAVLFLYFFKNMLLSFPEAIGSVTYILTHINATYDEKMRKEWKFYYDYMKFVDIYTQDNPLAIIATPPTEEPWLTTGNTDLSRYFVYPKKLVKGKYEALPAKDFDYVMIAKGRWDIKEVERYNWPKVFVPAKKIWYLNQDTLEVTEVETDFDPSDPRNKGAYGLIKVDKERL